MAKRRNRRGGDAAAAESLSPSPSAADSSPGGRPGPRIVDRVAESDDESILSDEAFNSEDDERWAGVFGGKKKKEKKSGKRGGAGSDDDDDESESESDIEEDEDDDDDGDDSSGSDSDGSSSGSDNEGDDDDDDDGILTDDDDPDGDGGRYMLDLLDRLDSSSAPSSSGKSSSATEAALALRSHGSLPESEHSSAAVPAANLTLDALMGGIADAKGFGEAQRAFRDVVAPPGGDRGRGGKGGGGDDDDDDDPERGATRRRRKALETTPAPLPRVRSERLSRRVHYGATSGDVSRWTSAVKANREAETLDFRPDDNAGRVTVEGVVEKFVPRTDFEREVEEALEKAGAADEGAMAEGEKERLCGAEEEGGDGGGDDDDDDDLGKGAMSLEEYQSRFADLSKMRALLFYEEQKRHRMNKIKSKRYRKIRKRKRTRDKEAERLAVADGEDGDPEEAERRLREAEEMERMKERMSLAHKNTSKWAKRVLRRGSKVDADTRKALSAHLQRGQDLRNKMMGGEGADGSDDDDDAEGLLERAKAVLQDTENDIDEAKGGGDPVAERNKGLFGLAFMKRGIEAQRERAREEARQLLRELEEDERDDYDEGSGDNDDDDDEAEGADEDDADGGGAKNKAKTKKKKKRRTATEAETAEVLPEGRLVATDLAFGNSNALAVGGAVEIDLSGNGSGSGGNAAVQEKDTLPVAPPRDDDKKKSKNKRKKTKKGKRGAAAAANEEEKKSGGNDHTATFALSDAGRGGKGGDGGADADDDAAKAEAEQEARRAALVEEARQGEESGAAGRSDNPWLSGAPGGGAAAADVVNDDEEEELPASGVKGRGKKQGRRGTNAGGAVNNSAVAAVVGGTPSPKAVGGGDVAARPGYEAAPEEEEEKKKTGVASLTQEELVRRAFAAPADADADFAREKREVLERDDPTLKRDAEEDAAATVSGWGSWAGAGAPPPRKKRRGGDKNSRLPKKLRPPEGKKKATAAGLPRRDDGKSRVIVSERRVRKNAKFQLGDVPRPYSSREEYERAMGGALGTEWNVTGAARAAAAPEVVRRVGRMIRPMASEAKAKAGGKKRGGAGLRRGPAKF